LCCILIVMNVFFYLEIKKQTTYTVDSKTLFEGFLMTQESKKTGGIVLKKYKDSIEYLKFQTQLANVQKKIMLEQRIIKYQQDALKFSQNFEQNETEKIKNRLTAYVKKYAEKKKYRLIVGINNSGLVLYSDQKHDITNEVLINVNKLYEGGN
jgi:Skp family chaperone for outer membrane proteins